MNNMGLLKEPEVESLAPKTIPVGWLNSYDFDGVITVGIIPRKNDMVISDRCVDEMTMVVETCQVLGVRLVDFYLNPKPSKSREDAGQHKADMILKLISDGVKLWNHFDDDTVQIKVIENAVEDRIEALKKLEKLDGAQTTELSILTEFHLVPVLTYRQIK
jgi:hypothetical protein